MCSGFFFFAEQLQLEWAAAKRNLIIIFLRKHLLLTPPTLIYCAHRVIISPENPVEMKNNIFFDDFFLARS